MTNLDPSSGGDVARKVGDEFHLSAVHRSRLSDKA
jgi:hypothetical protein